VEIRQLEYLIAVAEEGNFSRAAERVHVAQPSLSQQIKKLEDELGVVLFDRLPRRVVTTEAGARLVERARRILSEMADARREVGETRGEVTGTLAVGAIPTIAPFLLPDLLVRFRKRWPDVQLTVVEDVTDRLCDAVVNGRLDLALTSTIHDARSLHAERVAVEPLLALVPANTPVAKRKTMTWAALDREQVLVLHDDHCLSGQVTRYCKKGGSNPNVVAHGAQLGTVAAMVSAGLGVSVVPDMMRAGDRAKSRVYIPFGRGRPEREICILWSLLRFRTNAARAFGTLVRERFSL